MKMSGSLATLEESRTAGFSAAAQIVLFAALTAVGAQIEIPHVPVPFTLQTFFVLLAGAILGPRRGAASQVLYLLCGASGLPVFSGFSGGLLRLIGPTGGYLLAFPFAAYLGGFLFRETVSFLRAVVAMGAGALLIFIVGTVQLDLLYYHQMQQAIVNGFLLFSWWDAVKIFAAAGIGTSVARYRGAKPR
ncbi:MAG TPA: biotin transporter BioY [Bacteroidota bacterium]|nr:biotin transporter BioY [Bacteroidota bacterium]